MSSDKFGIFFKMLYNKYVDVIKMRKAVLLIHGLAGGTYDLENLTNFLQIHNFDTFTFTLPGHDYKRKVTKEDWINSCEEELKLIIKSGYKEIYVVGHSMGGILAAYLASKHKNVKKVVLAAAAFKHVMSDNNIKNTLKKSPEIIKSYSLSVVIDRLNKLHPSCLKEFLELVNEKQDVLKKVKCPIMIVQGMDDDLVPPSTAFMIFNKVNSKIKKLVLCDNCNHHIFKSENRDEIINTIEKFLRTKVYIKKNEFINL